MDLRTVVLSLEGLAVAPLGPYGCSWNQTPTLDSIAATGSVFDRCIVPSDDSTAILESLWQALPATVRLSVVSDHRPTIELAGGRECSEIQYVESADPDVPAEDVVATGFAQLLASGMDVLQRSDRLADQASLIWLHSDYLVRRWDAPRGLLPFEQWAVETDEDYGPPAEPEVELPHSEPPEAEAATANFFDVVRPPQLTWQSDHNPDVTLAWMNTYAAQVLLLDTLLSVVIDAIADRPTRLILIGTSGFALGENQCFGSFGPLHSPRIQIPVIGTGPGIPIARCGVPCTPAAALSSLLASPDEGVNLLSPAVWATEPDGFSPSVQTTGCDGSLGLTTPDWYYYRTADREQLFVKPDDRGDTNNVSSRLPEVLEQVRARL